MPYILCIAFVVLFLLAMFQPAIKYIFYEAISIATMFGDPTPAQATHLLNNGPPQEDIIMAVPSNILSVRDSELSLDVSNVVTRVGLHGKHSPVPPLLRFVCHDGAWKLRRGITRGHSDLPPPEALRSIRPAALMCPVCNKVDMGTCSNPRVHGTLHSWASIDIPVCKACSMRVDEPAMLPAGNCFCCFNATAERAVTRGDNGLIIFVCVRCSASNWIEWIREAGIHMTCGAIPHAKGVELVLAGVKDNLAEVANAVRQGCSHMGGESITCAATACGVTLCYACIDQRYPNFSEFYRGGHLWRCSNHTPSVK